MKALSFRQQAERTARKLAKVLVVNYAQFAPYSATIDKINRRPLLQNFMRQNSGVPSFLSREAMWSFITDRSPGPIDYLEFGVHRGHSILYFANRDKSPCSRFFGFDCFTGLPEDWKSGVNRGHFDTGGRIPATADPRVKFVVGLFQETLPEFVAGFKTNNRIIVNIDCDLYTSALYCLTRLDPILPKGTILIFDEFGDVLHEFRASSDYFSSHRRAAKAICSHYDFYTTAFELL